MLQNLEKSSSPRVTVVWMAGSVLGLFVLLLWDLSGLDLAMAVTMGGSNSFPLRDHFLLQLIMHKGAKFIAWGILFYLVLAIRWPGGFLRSVTSWDRARLPVVTLGCLLCISTLKYFSSTSCPWDLKVFGGDFPYVSHWIFRVSDGGGGHCFPAGHAATGFAFLGGYFVLARPAPRAALAWALIALSAGTLLGISQQVRGAHFVSHTLWTAWICWSMGGLINAALTRIATFRS